MKLALGGSKSARNKNKDSTFAAVLSVEECF
jgi:hypothetical protein